MRDEEIIKLAQYIIDTKSTVRRAASIFSCSKSNIWRVLVEVLPTINYTLASEVRDVLNTNKAERATRGAQARYKLKKENVECR